VGKMLPVVCRGELLSDSLLFIDSRSILGFRIRLLRLGSEQGGLRAYGFCWSQSSVIDQRAVFNFTPVPQGRTSPLGGMFTLSFTPSSTLYCLEEVRYEQRISP
jgi:hypothetical protein